VSADDNAIASSLAGAAQSLRDTSKWLVGGVIGTSAGVFAGSSLTALGSLDPTNDRWRLELAGAGLMVGLLALSFVFYFALRVLDRGSFTMRELAAARGLKTLAKIKPDLIVRYRTRFPDGVKDFEGYVRLVETTVNIDPQTDETAKILERATVDDDIISADAGLMFVKRRYRALLITLCVATPAAAAGFGVFAWAANPPKTPGPLPAFSLTCGPAGQAVCERLRLN
jgi:hypothetical protein